MLVRIVWRDGRPSTADVMWLRTVSRVVAVASAHVALKHLREWEDFVVGCESDDEVERVRHEAEARGHVPEVLGVYTFDYVRSALGCSEFLDEEQIRVTCMPSFHEEVVFTATRFPDWWRLETRIGRESLWYSRFSELSLEDWPKVRRSPGVAVVIDRASRSGIAAHEMSLNELASSPLEKRQTGADGMRVHVQSRLSGAAFEDEDWWLQPGTRVRVALDLVRAVHGPLPNVDFYLQSR